MQLQPQETTSFEAYLASERRATFRSELVDGQVVAMAGASLRHNEIVSNVVASLRRQLRRRGCGVYASDLRVLVSATELATYPDVVVVCGEPEIYDEQGDTLLNPRMIVEVLSSGTESFDRGEKFAQYRMLVSLTDYVLISQGRTLIEHFARQADGRWLLASVTGPEEKLEIPSLRCRLSVAEVYDRAFRPLERRRVPLPRP